MGFFFFFYYCQRTAVYFYRRSVNRNLYRLQVYLNGRVMTLSCFFF